MSTSEGDNHSGGRRRKLEESDEDEDEVSASSPSLILALGLVPIQTGPSGTWQVESAAHKNYVPGLGNAEVVHTPTAGQRKV